MPSTPAASSQRSKAWPQTTSPTGMVPLGNRWAQALVAKCCRWRRRPTGISSWSAGLPTPAARPPTASRDGTVRTGRDLAIGASGVIALASGSGIEVFDGGAWSLLPPPGPSSSTRDCEVLPNGDIVVAGWFTQGSGVVRWDGAAWQPVGSAPATNVLVQGMQGDLYRGPPDNSTGGHVARFDGTTWQNVGGAFDREVARRNHAFSR